MNRRFKRILIPVDFSINTSVAVKKALELAQHRDSEIHLLHVLPRRPRAFFGFIRSSAFGDKPTEIALRKRMESVLMETFSGRFPAEATYWIAKQHSVERSIISTARRINPDLIVIGKNSQHKYLPFLNTVRSIHIAKKSNVPVLTVKPGSRDEELKMIVVPIDDKYPERKVDMILALRHKFRGHIRLLLILEKSDDPDILQAALLNICQVLNYYAINNISYEVIPGRNRAADILRYSKRINADMLIVNPGRETRIGWLNKQISDEMPVQSRTQILEITNS
jgi:nucleotide-binding universal stress UspA family protein